MKTRVKLFGQLTDITKGDYVELTGVSDTFGLKKKMLEIYPLLTGHTFLIAVDRKVTNKNEPIGPESEIALLPPFSGG